MANQNSIISYVPQPYFAAGVQQVAVGDNIIAISNEAGLFDPDLSNRTSVSQDSGGTEYSFVITFEKIDDWLFDHDLTVALVGCSLDTYEDDGASAPDIETKFSEDISVETEFLNIFEGSAVVTAYGHAHNTRNEIDTYSKRAMPGIVAGGRANILHYGLGKANGGNGTGTITVHVHRLAANVALRPWSTFNIGHVFIGVDVPITLDPRTFNWSLASQNQRFVARDLGAKNSEGTLVRQVSADIIRINALEIIGSQITGAAANLVNALSLRANLFDLIKANTSYPLMFNPYPYASPASVVPEDYNLLARQNFFSIYGFMENALELQMDEFRDGLQSQYRARFQIKETR